MRLRYTPAARADLRAMRDYIIHTLKNPSAAQRLTAKIVESCARLKDQPRLGAALSEKTAANLFNVEGLSVNVFFLESALGIHFCFQIGSVVFI